MSRIRKSPVIIVRCTGGQYVTFTLKKTYKENNIFSKIQSDKDLNKKSFEVYIHICE